MRAVILSEKEVRRLAYAVHAAHWLVSAIEEGKNRKETLALVDLDRLDESADALEKAASLMREMTPGQLLAAAAL